MNPHEAVCRHHYIIEPCHDEPERKPVSPGVCKYCGDQKMHANSVADKWPQSKTRLPKPLPAWWERRER